ncbi:MAG: gamma-glutamyltransferase, partial [Ignavibacteria bacterium]|nr:gamma-glutamyltransferase [Ignavibacteria bacterium]
MVVTAEENATRIGVEILMKGGNAIDAAVAVGFALAVTYPVAGNIGGGGFMVIRMKDGFAATIDYRERAPAKAHRDMYLDKNGNPIKNMSTDGVTSAGVPGSVAGLLFALEKYGSMKLADVINPAIKLAKNGFKISYEFAQSLNSNYEEFSKYPSTKKIFTKKNGKFNDGELFVQKDLANTLIQIRDKGKDGFYSGKIAELIVKEVERGGGFITLDDLKNYKPIERKPVVGEYRGHKIISMGPPSSGGIALIEMLNILENIQFERNDYHSYKHFHYLIEAMKRAYADRAEHLGDADFYPVPTNQLIDKEYARKLFNSILFESSTPSDKVNNKKFLSTEKLETTHYSIYDQFGNAVSVTTTINGGYGSNVVVDGAGFFLNNEMDDFSIKPNYPNMFGLVGNEANSIQPNKRMLSSMTPTIVLKDDKPFLIVGSPGGGMIINTVLQVIMNVIDFGMNIQQAIDFPRIHHQWLPEAVSIEPYTIPNEVRE